jgi:hypothetical protein
MEVGSAPIILDVALHVRGSRNGVIPDGAEVASGDHLQVEITTSRDAHLHIAFCNRDQQLTVYPETGSILIKANTPTFAPERGRALALDSNAGPEALYVIVSQLDGKDPRLAAAIATTRPGGGRMECGRQLRAVLPKKKPSPEHRAPIIKPSEAREPLDDEPASKGWAGATALDRRAPSTPRFMGTARKHPAPSIERGAYVIWRGAGGIAAGGEADGSSNTATDPAANGNPDTDGIAILRYGLNHIAAPKPPVTITTSSGPRSDPRRGDGRAGAGVPRRPAAGDR